MRDFACVLSLARGFSRPAADGGELPASVDSEPHSRHAAASRRRTRPTRVDLLPPNVHPCLL